MSTPRTDAEEMWAADLPPYSLSVSADFARQLERELSAANAEIERSAVYQRLREIHQATVDQLTAAKTALEKARVIIRAYHEILPGDGAREALTAINEVLK